MQVFLPYKDPAKTAQCLDNKRLGKQRLECLQILFVGYNIMGYWEIPNYIFSHPTYELWKTNLDWLLTFYLSAIMREWQIIRGFNNEKCWRAYMYINEKINWSYKIPWEYPIEWHKYLPPFIKMDFCKKHQQLLLKKDYEYYKEKFDN